VTQCVFASLGIGSKCEACGYPLKKTYDRAPRRVCGMPARCGHLGDATGDAELVLCETCRGRVRQKKTLHVCTYHGSCLPGVAATAETERMACAKCRAKGLGFEPASP
jgi:hypothetical protein